MKANIEYDDAKGKNMSGPVISVPAFTRKESKGGVLGG